MTVRLKSRPVQAAASTQLKKSAPRAKAGSRTPQAAPSPKRKEFKRDKVESFRKQLTTRRDLLARELSQNTANLISDETTYSDALDQAAADIDKSFAVQMSNRERTILLQIDAALKRIDLGSYGTCAQCSESITEARMEVFPFTTLCIDCKVELESDQNRYSGRA